MLCKWENLPDYMRNDAVKEYYNILSKKKGSLLQKECLTF